MPNRIIRDAILDSPRYHALSGDGARLLYMEMLLLADDYGLLPVYPLYLARRTSAAARASDEAINRLVMELADQDLIRVYENEGRRFAYIPRFGNAPRAVKPKWPMPPDALGANEIKDLQRKRVAGAAHRGANAPETETETETETGKRQPPPAAPAAPKGAAKRSLPKGVVMLLEHGVDQKLIDDWLVVRKAKGVGAVTETVARAVEREAQAAGMSVQRALTEATERGWAGFKAAWLVRDAAPVGDQRMGQAGRSTAAAGASFMDKMRAQARGAGNAG